MRLCVPTLDDGGLAARLAPHFGSAPYYTIVETESGTVEALRNAHADHAHGTCEASTNLAGQAVDAVVCLGLGRRALTGLAEAGIEVFVACSDDVATAVDAFRSGRLGRLAIDAACRGGQGHCHTD
jgi:predicted Fe-Mo cluster-binding NifX family protein